MNLCIKFRAVIHVQAFEQVEFRPSVPFHRGAVVSMQIFLNKLIGCGIPFIVVVIRPFQKRALGNLSVLACRRILVSG